MITIQYEVTNKRGATTVKEKTFKSGTAYAAWLEKNDGLVNVLRTELPNRVENFNEAETLVIKQHARRIWNEIAHDCGEPDDAGTIAELVMDADRLTMAIKRTHPILGKKVDENILSRELERIVRSAF